MTTLALATALCLALVAAIAFGNKATPSWAQTGGIGTPAYKPLVSAEKREMLWRWYRTSGARCIARHEGGWESNTGNGYYGRFQANSDFAWAYGRHYAKRVSYVRFWDGMPHLWPKWAQIHMARHGYQARGWSPWPNTARACGLL
jgi:hypothetical protein